MKATLTSKGQITIPGAIRRRLGLKPGHLLEFDETTPYLKATRVIDSEAWRHFGKKAKNPWPGLGSREIVDKLRGPIEPNMRRKKA